MHSRCATENINEATAFTTCGVPVHIDKLLDDPTSKQVVTFYLGTENVQSPDSFKSSIDSINGPLKILTAECRHRLGTGELEEHDPSHPLLDCLRVLGNREMLLSYIKRDIRCRLKIHRRCLRMFYELGQEPMADKIGQKDFEYWTTADIKMAASIALVGVPVIGIREYAGAHEFILPRFGYSVGVAPIDSIALARRFRDGSLAKEQPDHPLLWGIQTLKNRDKLMSMVKGAKTGVLIRNPKSGAWNNHHRSAIVDSNATSAAFDDALKHNRRV